MDKIKLTSHALERLNERSVVDPDDLLSAVSNDQIELVTIEHWTNRVSYLFFSKEESMFHVLVIDISTQEIITILPVEYWQNLRSHDRENRFINEKSISKPMLFRAIMRSDRNNSFIHNPPLFGKKTIFIFASYTVDKKRKMTKIGSISIDDLANMKKEKCVILLRDCLSLGVESINSDDAICISWKTNEGKNVRFPEALQLIDFVSHVDYEILYKAIISDITRRIENTRIFPVFQWLDYGSN